MFTTKEKLNARGQTAEVPQRHGYTANYQSGVLMNATHGKEKKPNTKGHKYCASPPRENPEQARPQNQKKKKNSEGSGGEGQGVTADRQYVLRIGTNSILNVLNATRSDI